MTNLGTLSPVRTIQIVLTKHFIDRVHLGLSMPTPAAAARASTLPHRSGYADAAKLIADFQADVVAQVEAGHIDARMLAFVGGALHQSKIPASPEFAAAIAKHPFDQNEGGPLPTDVRAALAGILEACDGDPFMAVGSLIESGHAMPAETRGALAGALALTGIPEARGAAVLFLLDPDSAVRRAVAGALAQVAASLTRSSCGALILEHRRAPPVVEGVPPRSAWRPRGRNPLQGAHDEDTCSTDELLCSSGCSRSTTGLEQGARENDAQVSAARHHPRRQHAAPALDGRDRPQPRDVPSGRQRAR